jgi:hypothetical protein
MLDCFECIVTITFKALDHRTLFDDEPLAFGYEPTRFWEECQWILVVGTSFGGGNWPPLNAVTMGHSKAGHEEHRAAHQIVACLSSLKRLSPR